MGDFGDALSIFRANRRVWEVKHAPPTLVREARLGARTKVVGHIEALDTLTAPLTLAPCVAFRVRLEEERRDLGMRKHLASGEGHVPFFVVDEEGRRIRVDRGELILGATFADVTARATVDEANTELLRAIGAARLKEAIALQKRGVAILLEDRVAPGERVAVRGLVTETQEVMAMGYRDAIGRGLCLRAAVDDPLVLCRA